MEFLSLLTHRRVWFLFPPFPVQSLHIPRVKIYEPPAQRAVSPELHSLPSHASLPACTTYQTSSVAPRGSGSSAGKCTECLPSHTALSSLDQRYCFIIKTSKLSPACLSKEPSAALRSLVTSAPSCPVPHSMQHPSRHSTAPIRPSHSRESACLLHYVVDNRTGSRIRVC